MMLDINPETVCFLISKAKEFHAQEEVVIPDVPDNPSDDWGLQALASHGNDPTLLEFKSTFNDLEPDQQVTVVALFWLGRGDFDVDEWQSALDEAGDNWTPETANYLIAHPMLADHLLEGLSLLDYSCE
jgi:hypothetical protein